MSLQSNASNLTQAQALIWTGQQLDADAPLYNMMLAFRISGPVDVSRFERAFAALVDATDAMRTVFREADGIPQRIVLDSIDPQLSFVDLSAEADAAAACSRLVKRDSLGVFDLTSRLFRSGLVRLGADDYVWWLSQHHLVTDGWAVAIVYQRMAELYQDLAPGIDGADPEKYPSFEFYAAFESDFRDSEEFGEAEAFWRHKAEAPIEPPSFYGVAPDPAGTTRTDRVTKMLGPERSARIAALTTGAGSLMSGKTQFTVFASVLFALLSRVTDQSNLAILAPAANRPSQRFKSTAGLFIEVLPLHADLEAGETFASLMEKVGMEAQGHLLNARPGASSASHNRAYSVLLNFINVSFGDFGDWPMESEWVHPGHGDRDHALRLQVHDFDGTGDWVLHFDLSRDVFDEVHERLLIRHFLALLDALLDDPAAEIAGVDLLTEEERRGLERYNATDAPVPFATVVEAFSEAARVTPDADAVVCGETALTYAALDAASNLVAARIRRTATSERPRVAIYLPRSAEMVVAALGALKAGASYVPIDRHYPADRIEFVLHDSGTEVVITDSVLARDLPEVAPDVLLVGGPAAEAPGALDGIVPSAADTAYVMYTSGSTGEPKGVVVSHGALANYVAWAVEQYGHGSALSFPLYSSFGFDLTVTSLFVPLVSGGTVVVYPEQQGADLSIVNVFADDAVDVVKLTPSHLALIDPALLDTRRIRALILGGEELKTSVARRALDASGGGLTIFNEYGPTETTVGCMVHRFDPDEDDGVTVPLGHPSANARIHLLDERGNPAPIGVVGELCIAGAGVADGYLGSPELSDERFVEDPFRAGARMYRSGDLARWVRPGVMEFLGRADTQVKLRGFRIELGEIETILADDPAIEDAFVDVVESEAEAVSRPGEAAHCVRCGLSSQHPDAHLDDDGVCRPCHFYETYRGKAEEYFGTTKELTEIFSEAVVNEAGQDCVMLLSGGKDSTYALYQLVEMGRTPLVFSLDNGFISEGAIANIKRAVDDLGLELVMGTTAAMNEIFADSLSEFSNVCQGCFKTVYTLGMNLAHERGLRQVVTGLSRGQIFETRLADLFRIGIVEREEVDAAIIEARRAYHQVNDAVRRSLDTTIFDDPEIFDEIKIVDFYRYRDVGLEELYAFLSARAPWVRPADTGRSTNCLINNTGIFVHKKERGFHNYSLPYSWDVRLGHKTREEALAELDDEIDVTQVRSILGEVGYRIDVPEPEAPQAEQFQRRLVGYYVARDESIMPADVRRRISTQLADYMVPSYLVRLDALPLTVNGKVDRSALPDPRLRIRADHGDYVAPRTPIEQELAATWQDVLGIETIGVFDPFVELGGDSILNIQIVAKAKRRGLRFTPQQLFEHKTIADLATVVEVEESPPRADPIPVPTTGGFTPAAFPEAGLDQAELDELLRTYGDTE